MNPVHFPGVNVTYGKDQPEYRPLPAMKIPGNDGEVITCWELSEEELEEVKNSKRVFLSQLTFNGALQPVRIMASLADNIALTYDKPNEGS